MPRSLLIWASDYAADYAADIAKFLSVEDDLIAMTMDEMLRQRS